MMFEGEDYRSYRDLMRELRLPRRAEYGDWFLSFDPDTDPEAGGPYLRLCNDDGGGCWGSSEPLADGWHLVWLPSLAQWLAMLEEAGVDVLSWAKLRKGGYGYARERSCGGRCDETSGSHWHEDGEPVFAATHEEAAARLWMALTGRTVTSG